MPYRPLLLLAFACFFGMSPWFSVAVIGPQLQGHFGISKDQLIELALGVQLGFVVGALVSSIFNLADVFGPRVLVIVGAFAAAACNLIPLWNPSYPVFFIARFTTGASLALLYPAGLKVMATWVQARRGTALGILLAGLTLGTAAPHAMRAASFQAQVEWTSVLWGTSLLASAGGCLVLLWGKQGPFPFPKAPFNPRLIASILTQRKLKLIALGYFGHMWELYAMWFWFPVFVHARMQGQGIEHVDALSALYSALALGSGAIGCWLGGRWGDRVSRVQAVKISLAVSGTCAALIGWDGLPLGLVLVLGVIWGFSVNADSAQFSTLTSTYSDHRYVGTTLTLQLALGFLITGITIHLVPHFVPQFGWGICLASLALGPLTGYLAMIALEKDLEKILD